MLSMITIGVGCTAACAISKPTLISMLRLRPRICRNDVDADVHADERFGRTEVDAVQRDRLARIARHRPANEAAGAVDPVGGIELDPAAARQVVLNPALDPTAATITPTP